MQGINPEKIPELVKKDVNVVLQEAKIILKISPDGKMIEIVENPHPRLGVIAVIGPAKGLGQYFAEALLTEIGIGRSRPYHRAYGIGKPENPHVPKRRKWFYLSPSQYGLVAPIIFRKIERMAYEKLASWAKGPFSDDPFLIRSRWIFWTKRGSKFYDRVSWALAIRGARFSISLKDELFVRDIYWAELNLNAMIKKRINGLAGFISKRINWYRRRYKYRKPFSQLEGVKQIQEAFQRSSLSRHLHMEAIRLLRDDRKKETPFFPYIADMFGWDGKETKERKLASLACSDSSDPKSRLGDIQLRVTTGLEEKKDYIVFEVVPRQK